VSYDVSLGYPDGRPCSVASHEEGGTYVLGGSPDPDLNVTYNYAGIYRTHGFSIRDLDGKRAGDTVLVLSRLVDLLGTERAGDYWAATDGNAGYAASILLDWAGQHPNAIWSAA
jgi:hypothetical protein